MNWNDSTFYIKFKKSVLGNVTKSESLTALLPSRLDLSIDVHRAWVNTVEPTVDCEKKNDIMYCLGDVLPVNQWP